MYKLKTMAHSSVATTTTTTNTPLASEIERNLTLIRISRRLHVNC